MWRVLAVVVNPLRQVLFRIDELAAEGERTYRKSKDIAEGLDIGAREVGYRLRHVRLNDDIPVAVEKWSETGQSTTYAITIEDQDDLDVWFRETRGRPEPTFS